MKSLSPLSLLLYSLPCIAASLLTPLFNVVDTALVGNLNTTWLAALTVGTTLLNSFTWVFNFLIHVSTQGISEAKAKKDSSILKDSVLIPLYTAVILAFISMPILYFFRTSLFNLAGGREELIIFFEYYFLIQIAGLPFSLLFTTLLSLLRGMEKISLSLALITIASLVNIFLSWLLLYRFHWGIEATAISSVMANLAGVLLSSFFLFPLFPKGTFKSIRLEKKYFLNFGKNSFNLFCRSFLLTGIFFISTRLAGNLGIVPLAAHQILLQFWLLSSYFIDGLAISANILGAKFMANRETLKFKKLSLTLMKLGASIGLFFTLFFLLNKTFIWGWFTSDTSIEFLLDQVWFLIWSFQIINGISFVMDGLLFGTGDFSFLRRHMFIGVCITFLPCAFLSLMTSSFPPIWWGIALLNIYRGVSGWMKVKTRF